jgi:UDP-glucose 4-epimerase
VFNIGGGSRITLNSVVDLLGRVTGKTPDARYRETQKGDVMHTLADIALATRELGYVPRVGIEEGITREVEWLDHNRPRVGT